MQKFTTTYSMWSLFRNCRRACYWRYIRELVPITRKVDALRFGSLIHECLELWHGTRDLYAVMSRIDSACAARDSDPDVARDYNVAMAMMDSYSDWEDELDGFSPEELEVGFRGYIRNPKTNRPSRALEIAGKIDGIVSTPDGVHILEHKTASTVDGGYLERLWTDTQIILYSHYARTVLQYPIVGVIYNVLAKPRLRQKQNETGEEFQARLVQWYHDNDAFTRVRLMFDTDDYARLVADLWELGQQFLDCRRRDTWYQNTQFCFHWNRACPYFAICRSKDNLLVIENGYEYKAAHSELAEQTKKQEELW